MKLIFQIKYRLKHIKNHVFLTQDMTLCFCHVIQRRKKNLKKVLYNRCNKNKLLTKLELCVVSLIHMSKFTKKKKYEF